MQPLALQNASITTDAGDSAGSAASSGKSPGGLLFGELMAAAAQPTKSGDAANVQAAVDPDSQAADEAVAALAAATQAASRGVSLKAAPAPVEIHLSLAFKAPDGAVDDVASDLAAGDNEANPDHKVETAAADLATVTDPSNMNVQALIQMAVSASITVAGAHGEMTDATDTHVAPTQQDEAANELQAITALTASTGVVDSLTQGVATGAIQTTVAADAVTPVAAGETTAPPRIPALQAVAWFDGAAKAQSKDEAALIEGSVAQAEGEAHEAAPATQASSDSDLSDDASRDVSEIVPPTPQADPGELAAQAAAMMSAPPVNAPTPAGADQPLDGDPLLQGSRAAAPQWTDPAAQGNMPANPQSGAVQGQLNAQGAAGIEKADGSAQATTTMNAEAPEAMAPGAQGAAETALVATIHSADIRGLTQLNPTTTSPAGAAPAAPAPLSYDAEQPPHDKSATHLEDAQQTKAGVEKADKEDNKTASADAPAKGDVNIRELLKLGVTDVALSHEAPPLVAPQAEADQLAPILVPDMTNTIASTPQASTAATTNVETNGERRTMAEDIRLRALERMVVNAARNGTQTLSIQLYPPGLGQVVLRLAMDGQRLRLATRASTTEAADTLRNMENDLRNALSGNGLHLAGFDVSEDGPNDEAPRRQQPAEPVIKTRSGGTDESFTVELNA